MTTKRVYLDRIEGEVAVLLPGGDGDSDAEEHVPRSALPPDAREGDWLTATTEEHDAPAAAVYTREEAATEAARERVRSLMDELAD